MKTLLENIAALFKVKSIMTIALTLALVYSFLKGNVSPEVFVSLASSVVTYYFTKNSVSRETTAEQSAQSQQSDVELQG